MDKTRRYERPIKIAEGIFWVGFHDEKTNFHCNPYLIVESDQAVLIDGGSRPDFPVVMMKILQTGVDPRQIVALVYQHYDPDLCGSMPNLVDACENPNLRVYSDPLNNLFINYYIGEDRHHLVRSIDDQGLEFTFNSRVLKFFKTPYAHCPGSFITYDVKTGTLFTSDLFGSLSKSWDLFIKLEKECHSCLDYGDCVNKKAYCPIPDVLDFHRKVMPSGKALKYAMDLILKLDPAIVAPQHGSVFLKREDVRFISRLLGGLDKVGIDGFLPE
jgi:flavorubredoxin